jgi:hypothetical protein
VTWPQFIGIALVGLMFFLALRLGGDRRLLNNDLGAVGCLAGVAFFLGLIAWIIIAVTTPKGWMLNP